MADHVVYVDSDNRNQDLFPNSNSYTLYLTTPLKNISKVEVLSAMFPSVYSSQYLTLDILELRTPTTLVADALATGKSVPTSNAFDGSFAVVPIKAATSLASNATSFSNTSFIYNNEFYNSNYKIQIQYPSRIDSLDRLTITWRQPNNGNVFIDNSFTPPKDLGRNMFLLKFTCLLVPEEPERPASLPDPVPWESGSNMKLYIMIIAAILGLLVILFARRPS